MPMMTTSRSALRAAPDQVWMPLPVVEKAALTSGLPWRMATALASAADGSKPSIWVSSVLMSGNFSASVLRKESDIRFSVSFDAPCVIATVPLPPSFSPMAMAALAPALGMSSPVAALRPSTVPSGGSTCQVTIGKPSRASLLMKGKIAGSGP